MRHRKQGRKLNRSSAHRRALLRNLVLSLIRHGRITTTDAKAKELRRHADRIVTLGKRGDLAARRRAFGLIASHGAVKKLFDEIAPRFKERNGGYTRVVKFAKRRGDAAPLSLVEFTGAEEQAGGKRRRSKVKGERELARHAAAASG